MISIKIREDKMDIESLKDEGLRLLFRVEIEL